MWPEAFAWQPLQGDDHSPPSAWIAVQDGEVSICINISFWILASRDSVCYLLLIETRTRVAGQISPLSTNKNKTCCAFKRVFASGPGMILFRSGQEDAERQLAVLNYAAFSGRVWSQVRAFR